MAQPFVVSDVPAGIGVPHYVHPEPARYRLLFGMGENIGRISDDPFSITFAGSYQFGAFSLGAELLSSSSTGGAMPTKTFAEVGALVGYSEDYDLAGYASKPQYIHASIAAGPGVVTYSERWRRPRGRGAPVDTTALIPPVTQSAMSFPIQVKAVYEVWRYVGIGTMLWLDVNSIAPSYGAAIVLEARY
jgi:hypothetical protein